MAENTISFKIGRRLYILRRHSSVTWPDKENFWRKGAQRMPHKLCKISARSDQQFGGHFRKKAHGGCHPLSPPLARNNEVTIRVWFGLPFVETFGTGSTENAQSERRMDLKKLNEVRTQLSYEFYIHRPKMRWMVRFRIGWWEPAISKTVWKLAGPARVMLSVSTHAWFKISLDHCCDLALSALHRREISVVLQLPPSASWQLFAWPCSAENSTSASPDRPAAIKAAAGRPQTQFP